MNTVITEKFMPTKASIVQRLLDEKQITAEEAVVLLENKAPIANFPITNLPQTPVPTFPNPYTPINPFSPNTFPIYPGTPYIYCSTTTDNVNK